MTNELLNADLSPRAGIAMLTLQLRSTLQEAERLEGTDHTVDEAAARRQLRDRLDPLLAERQRQYDEALAVARAEAQEQIANARLEVERRTEAAQWQPEPVAKTPIVAMPVVEEAPVVEELPVVEEVPVVEELSVVETPMMMPPVVEEAPIVEVMPVVETPVMMPPVVEPMPVVETPVVEPMVIATPQLPAVVASRPEPQEIKVSIDADAFARVFATVFATLVEQRNVAQPMGQPYAPGAYVQNPAMMYAPAPQAPVERQSFWSHARHPDVLLMSLATAIVMVVVVAWLV